LETVTPLFLGGADPRGEPEFRVPSLRGALRFWLRALLGGVEGGNPSKVWERESRVFGSTESASPIIVLSETSKPSNTIKYSDIIFSGRERPSDGLKYLLFSARKEKGKDGKPGKPERTAIAAGERWKITFLERIGNGNPYIHALSSLWLLTHLGGLGSRSRRGLGSLQVVETNGNLPEELPSLYVKSKDPEEYHGELQSGLVQLRRGVGGGREVKFEGVPSFDVLHPSTARIWVINRRFGDWRDALNTLGLGLKRGRLYGKVKIDEIIRAKRTGNLPHIGRSLLGLPILFSRKENKKLRTVGTLVGRKGKEEKRERRASPLLMHVTRLRGCYVAVLTLFESHFLDVGSQLILEDRGRVVAKGPLPSWEWFNGFLDEFSKTVGELMEVTGW